MDLCPLGYNAPWIKIQLLQCSLSLHSACCMDATQNPRKSSIFSSLKIAIPPSSPFFSELQIENFPALCVASLTWACWVRLGWAEPNFSTLHDFAPLLDSLINEINEFIACQIKLDFCHDSRKIKMNLMWIIAMCVILKEV